jgi:hypothetical protein
VSRIAAWRWLVRDVPAGQILPPWLTVCQIIMFPRRTLLWLLSRDCGFDILTCCWKIHGVRFSDCVFMSLAEPRRGALYRFERKAGSDLVTIIEVPLPLPQGGEGEGPNA